MEKTQEGPPPAYPAGPVYPGAQPPPPQYGYPAPHPAGAVVVTQSQVVSSGVPHRFNETPMMMQCQYCQATVTTTTDRQVGLLTWMAAGGVCLLGGILGCCLIPFCVDPLKDVEHRCPNCQQVVGYYRLMR